MQEDDAGKGDILFVYRVLGCWRAVLGFRDIIGYFRIFTPNVLHMFYSFTDVLHSTNEKVMLKGLKTADK